MFSCLITRKPPHYHRKTPEELFFVISGNNYKSHSPCDPDRLVQPRSPGCPPKSIGEGASSVFGGWPGSPENVSCSRATPRLHRCKSGVALEQETFSGLPGHPPKTLLAPSPIDLGGHPGLPGLYQAIRVATLPDKKIGNVICNSFGAHSKGFQGFCVQILASNPSFPDAFRLLSSPG